MGVPLGCTHIVLSLCVVSVGLLVCCVAPPVPVEKKVEAIRGVHPSAAWRYSQPSFLCLDGTRSFDPAVVNDDYCDCIDGSDEPATAACPQFKFFCLNRGSRGVYIPSSHVDDGVCDCCDGSDEFISGKQCPFACPNDGEDDDNDGAFLAREAAVKRVANGDAPAPAGVGVGVDADVGVNADPIGDAEARPGGGDGDGEDTEHHERQPIFLGTTEITPDATYGFVHIIILLVGFHVIVGVYWAMRTYGVTLHGSRLKPFNKGM
eukprot:Opistho-2@85644